MNSHGSAFLIILDLDARRLIKRQKLSHPRPDILHEVGKLPVGLRHGVVSQHVSKVGRRQLDESHPLKRNANDNRKPRITTTTAISGEVGRGTGNTGRSKFGPMAGLGSEVNPTEVRTETLSFFVLG